MVRFLLPALMAGVVLVAGCDKGPPPQVPVHGKVTLDKEPLKEGDISFLTAGKAPETLTIKNGAYQGQVTPGSQRVEIRAYKEGEVVPMEGVKTESNKVNYLPAKYNAQSDLKAEVKPGDKNEFNFDLTSE